MIYSADGLRCVCGNANLHQEQVKVYWREGEDSNLGRCVSSTKQKTEQFEHQSGNPSPRRDGLLIRFSCEHCFAEPELAIYQHKGATYMKWHSTRAEIN